MSQPLNESKGFIRVPSAVLTSPQLSSSAKLVYGAMLAYAQKGGYCFASHERIGERLGMCRTAVSDAVRDLKAHNFIEPLQIGETMPPDLHEMWMRGGFKYGRTKAYRCLYVIRKQERAKTLTKSVYVANGDSEVTS